MDAKYIDFFLNTSGEVVQLEMFVISHPNFSRDFAICRNCREDGITVKHENGDWVDYEYLPVKIDPKGAADDLDQSLAVTIGDLGEIIPKELSRVRAAGGLLIKPTLTYRTYRSDDLDSPMLGPFIFEMGDLSFNAEGVGFTARAPSLNITKTGEIYDLERFPTLRAFV